MTSDRLFKSCFVIPVVFVAVLVFSYTLFISSFINCKADDKGEPCHIQTVDLAIVTNTQIPKSSKELLDKAHSDKNSIQTCDTSQLISASNTSSNSPHAKTLEECSDELTGRYSSIQQQIDQIDIGNVNKNSNANRSILTNQQTNVNTRLALVKQKLTERQAIINESSSKVGQRYSYRVTWVFFSAVLVLLCFVSMTLSFFIESDALNPLADKNFLGTFSGKLRVPLWLLVTFVSAIITSYVIYHSDYMSVAKDLVEHTVGEIEGISLDQINFFNVSIFFASVFLVGSASAILFSGGRVPQAQNADEKTAILVRLGNLIKDSKILLYVGMILLLVGMARLEITTQWVASYYPTEIAKTLNNFGTYSLAVQGGFFTLLLAVVYLPMGFVLQEKARLVETDEKKLSDQGFVADYKAIIARLVAILAPLLAGTLGTVLKTYLGS